MKVEKVTGVKCPHCEEVITHEDDVEVVAFAGEMSDALGRTRKRKVEAIPLGTLWRCGECEQVYEDRSEAAACCKD